MSMNAGRVFSASSKAAAAAACLPIMLLLLCTVIKAQTDTDVLIIGAGVAGLKAATDLRAKGIKAVILEARNRPLGRIYTRQDDGWPIPIELGAQWFHGDGTSNVVYTYATETLQVPTAVTSRGGNTFNGSKLVPDDVNTKWDDLYSDFQGTYLPDFRSAREETAVRQPLSAAVSGFIASKRLSVADTAGFQSKINTNIVQEYAADVKDLNLELFDDGAGITGEDSVPLSGYRSVFSSMLQAVNSNIRLNTEVTRIALSPTTPNRPFKVDTSKGNSFTARYIICTLPVGVLQAKLASLFPAAAGGAPSSTWLSQPKVSAIKALGMGTLNKVILQFPSPFWAELTGSQSWITRLATDPKYPLEFFSLFEATQQPILVAFYAGRAAVAAEASDFSTYIFVLTTLKTMFGSAYEDPKRYVITRWAQDPYSLGSYSIVKPGTSARGARSRLSQPEANKRFFFAGEAVSVAYPATVQGAWLSGANAAADLFAVYKRSAQTAGALADASSTEGVLNDTGN